MKRIIFTLCICLSSISLFAQSLSIENPPAGIIVADPFYETQVYGLQIKNNTNTDLEIIAERVENKTAYGHNTYFCWDICYDTTDNLSIGALQITSGNFTDALKLYLIPNGVTGSTEVAMRFYDRNDTTIEVFQTFVFDVPNSMDNIDVEPVLSAPYPNPARHYAFVDYEIPPTTISARIHIYNIIGKQIRTMDIMDRSGKLKIDVSDLNSGIYFLYLNIDGKETSSRKLIVSK